MVLGVHQDGLIGVVHRLGEGEGAQAQLTAPGVKPGQGEQVLQNVGHAVGLVEDDPQEPVLHLRGQVSHPVVQSLGVALDVGQRGAQLVGHVGHKVLALLLRLFQLVDVGLQLLGHDVEALGELADLIAGGHLQLPGEVPLGHLLDAKLPAEPGVVQPPADVVVAAQIV